MFAELVDDASGLSDQALREQLRANELERRRLDAEMAGLVSEVERRALGTRVDGHRSTVAFLRAELNCSTSDAAQWRSLGRAVGHLDGVGDAWMAGRIGRGQARRIASARSNPRVRERMNPFVPTLLEQAETLEEPDFAKVVHHTIALLDADGAHDARDHAIEHRRANVSAVAGTLALTVFGGDGLTAAEVEVIFERFCDAEYAADVAERARLHPEHPADHPLPRTAGQRRHDAIIEIFRAAGASDRAGTEAELVLNIVTDAQTFAAAMHSAGLATGTNLAGERIDPFTGLAVPSSLLDDLVADPASLASRRCETTSGIELHPHDVLRAALSGHVRRVVVDSAGVVIDQGRRQRLFTGSARTAAMMLIRTCEHPGCRTPARFSHVDHSEEWSRGGSTNQSNSGIGCGPHNRSKHEHGWRTRRSKRGRSYTVRKDGTIMLPVGASPPDLESSFDRADVSA